MPRSLAFLIWVLFQETTTSGQIELNADVCHDASRSFLIACLTIAAVVAILAVLLKRVWDRRQAMSPGLRFGLSLALAFVISSLAVAFNPFKPQYFLNCIEDLEFARFVVMANVAAVPRGLVLGGLVSVGFYLLLTVILSIFSRRGRR
jgi:formate-dependent nitrite reductase membrane component NrfD